MKLTYKKGTVEIFCHNWDAKKPIGGFRICNEVPFAFRRVEGLWGDCYEITHVPTGMLLPVNAYANDYFQSFKNTKSFLESLADQNIDWQFTDAYTDHAAGNLKKAAKFVKEYFL